MEHISKHHADESLKAQQDAAASAAAQAAAAAAAAPAPLIRTLPNNKTVYTSQNITTVPVICSSGQSQTLASADSTAMQIPIPENSYIVAEFSLKPESQESVGDVVSAATAAVQQEEETQHQEILATIPLSSNLTIQ